MTAGYLITGPAPVLVETGSQSSVAGPAGGARPTSGSAPGDLAGVAVTHIHLDHAGGVGDVARAFPSATVYVHEKGARHLVDPTRLVDSAARVYGALLDSLYGRLDPTPAERIHVLEDGEEIRVGPDRVLDDRRLARATPSTIWPCTTRPAGSSSPATRSGCGSPTPGCCGRPPRRPTSTSTRRCTRSTVSPNGARPGWPWPTTGCYPTRSTLLDEAEDTLPALGRGGRDGMADRRGHRRRPGPAPSPATWAAVDPAHREKLETLNGVHSNAAGFRRWLETRAGARRGIGRSRPGMMGPSFTVYEPRGTSRGSLGAGGADRHAGHHHRRR